MTYFHVSESLYLRGELRGSKATERGEGLGGGCPPFRARNILHFEPEKTVSDAYILGKDN